jgi:putative flippase GtrA
MNDRETATPLADARLLGKHQVAAVLGTSVDFASMVALVELLGLSPPAATMLSAVAGGVTNFVLSRRWVFRASRREALPAQMLRYAMTSLGGAALNALLLMLVLRTSGGVPYVAGRVVVAVLVSLAYTYPMHARFVFSSRAARSESGSRVVAGS